MCSQTNKRFGFPTSASLGNGSSSCSEPGESTDKSTDKTIDSAAPPPGLLAKALFAIASPALVSTPEKSCDLFLAAHHPVVARGRRKGSVWRVRLLKNRLLSNS